MLVGLFKNNLFLIFLFVLLISFFIRSFSIAEYNIPFTSDQGRDMLELRDIIVGLNPTLIGPTTSINGVFLGPFWFYFNVFPFVFSGGDPLILTYWLLGWYLASFLLVTLIIWEKDPDFALWTGVILTTAPPLFYASKYGWNANLMPVFTVFYFVALISGLTKNKSYNFYLLGLLVGLSLQIEAAFGVLFVPFTIGYLIVKKTPIKDFIKVSLSFFITLIPQLLFEIKNDFLMTGIFLDFLTGTSEVLGLKMSLAEYLRDHLHGYEGVLKGSFYTSFEFSFLLLFILLISFVYLYIQKKTSSVTNVYVFTSLAFLIFSFIFYMFYPYHLKSWFTTSLVIPFTFIIAGIFSQFSKINKYVKITLLLAFILYFINLIYPLYTSLPKANSVSEDPSNLKNRQVVVDWIYEKAQNQPFKVYNFIPSIYDYPYQYTFWWYGQKRYGYLPSTLTYQDNAPEYIPNNSHYLTNTKPADDSSLIFLLTEESITQHQIYKSWQGNFSHLCEIEEKVFPWKTKVEIRKICSSP